MSRKAWFYRQLLSYMPAFFIVVSFIFFVFFQLLSEQNRKEAMKANETLLLQAMHSVDSSLKTIDQMLLTEMINNPDLQAFFTRGKQDDVLLNMQVVKAMNQFMLSYPLVGSMYLVRTSDQFVISNATSSRLQDYADYEFIKSQLEAEGSQTSWKRLRDFREFSFKDVQHMVTLVRKAPFAANGAGFVVINVSADSIYSSIESMYNPEVSFIRILDSNGVNMFASHGPKEGKAEIFSRYTSPYTGWVYQSGLVSGKLVSIANQLYSVWVMIGVLMIAAGVGWIVFVTRRNYKPIEQIVTRIQSFTLTKSNALLHGKRQDEFAFIESALDSIMEQSNRFQQEHREDLLLKKAYLFQQLLDGRYPRSIEQWEGQRAAMQLPDLSQRQSVSVVEIDNYAQFCAMYPERDQYLIKFALKSVIQEIAQKHDTAVWAEWLSVSTLGVLAQIEDGQDGRRQVLSVLEHVRTWVEENLKLTITAGAGEPADDFTLIPESYAEALQALKYKMILGENEIIPYAAVAKEEQGSAFAYLHLVHAWCSRSGWRRKIGGTGTKRSSAISGGIC
ncbi:PDC sensor domain-containing protein [Gordoniibacillus kamchatkensis]|uniref:PDC sensor domain-containing protein n=1 Tax=Gordoniibacillus kamchatkensis TaxID=1590651 RepID=UPI000A8E992E|nr:AraC family transcriptional regulator [Paenibacillus sp. VKM B-2647]